MANSLKRASWLGNLGVIDDRHRLASWLGKLGIYRDQLPQTSELTKRPRYYTCMTKHASWLGRPQVKHGRLPQTSEVTRQNTGNTWPIVSNTRGEYCSFSKTYCSICGTITSRPEERFQYLLHPRHTLLMSLWRRLTWLFVAINQHSESVPHTEGSQIHDRRGGYLGCWFLRFECLNCRIGRSSFICDLK